MAKVKISIPKLMASALRIENVISENLETVVDNDISKLKVKPSSKTIKEKADNAFYESKKEASITAKNLRIIVESFKNK